MLAAARSIAPTKRAYNRMQPTTAPRPNGRVGDIFQSSGARTISLDHFPRGVLVPALTPFQADLTVDGERFAAHCRWLLSEGADGLAVFGTTSEANSLDAGERWHLLERLIDGGIAPGVLMPGTGCCALPDTVALTRHAVEHGCFGVLMLPPFYYKGVGDDGIYASIAEVVERVGDSRLRVYLYHIPPMASVGFSRDVIGRVAQGLPRHRRRAQGQLRRLESHARLARSVSGVRSLSGQRNLPARCAAARRCRLHFGDGKRQRRGDA